MRKLLITGVILLLIAGAVWYVASPHLAMRGLREAARAGDAQELDRYVDFPAVRENLKTDIKSEIAGRRSNNPLVAIGVLIGGAVVDQAVDALVSPSSIAAVASGRRPRPSDEAVDSSDTRIEARDYRLDRQGLNQFTVRFTVNDRDAPALVFTRRGLTWELTRIGVRTGRRD